MIVAILWHLGPVPLSKSVTGSDVIVNRKWLSRPTSTEQCPRIANEKRVDINMAADGIIIFDNGKNRNALVIVHPIQSNTIMRFLLCISCRWPNYAICVSHIQEQRIYTDYTGSRQELCRSIALTAWQGKKHCCLSKSPRVPEVVVQFSLEIIYAGCLHNAGGRLFQSVTTLLLNLNFP